MTKLKVILIIVTIGFVVFTNMLSNGFVFDDGPFILNNPDITSFNTAKLFGPSTFNDSRYYRPLPAVYFTLLYSITGNQVFLYHFSQLSLHITMTVVLFLFLSSFFDQAAALLLALIFLVHPINVDSVSYISAVDSELFSLPGLLALLLITQPVLTRKRSLLIAFLLSFSPYLQKRPEYSMFS